MKFRILGQLEVRDEHGEVALGGPKPRAVLAMLLLHANEPLSPERLAIGLWGEDAPQSAVRNVHVHVSRLRKALGGTAVLETTPAGYRLSVDACEFDGACFARLVDDAHRAHELGRFDRAAHLLREALALWRGPALADVASEPFAVAAVARLEEQRLVAIEARVAADLAIGRAGEILPELQQLVAEHPTRERLTADLMLALYRCGQQSAALEAFRALRRVLVDEVGVEPGPELRQLHQAVLQQAPSLALGPLASSDSDGKPDATAAATPSPGSSTVRTEHPISTANKTATDRTTPDGTVPLFPLPAVAPRTREGAFVGRERYLEQLRSRWDESCSGRTSLVLLMGEAGIGKTRLAVRFADEVHEQRGIVLYGRADAEALLPYQPFAEALGHLVDHAGAHLAEELALELSVLSRLFPHLRRHADPSAVAVDHNTLRYQIFEAVVSVLVRASASQPLLLVLDDLHWADQLTLLLLRHVLRRIDGARLLVLGTFRDAEVPRHHPLNDLMINLRRERRYDRLTLEGFDEKATRHLVKNGFALHVTPTFVQRLQRQTHGNAFFIEETLRALADSELSMEAPVDEIALGRVGVPDGVAEVILRRVHQLSGLASEVLTAASVMGSSFHLGIVEQLVEAGPDAVIAALEEAITARLVLEGGELVDMFTFSHSLVREVLYDGIIAAHRVRMHYRVAQALESLSERVPVNPAELAHHFALAQRIAGREPARRYAIAAGWHAAGQFAYEDAGEHYRRALELFDDDDDAGRCDVLLALGRVQWHAGDDGARVTFLDAAESAERRAAADQLARAALGLGERYFEVTYLGARYRDLLEKALAAVGPSDSPRRALLLARLAVNLGFPDEDGRAQQLAAEAVTVARRIEDERLLVAVLIAQHITLLDVRHIEKRLAIGGELSSLSDAHQELAAERHHWRMYDLLGIGDLESAQHEHTELLVLAERLGQPLLRSLAEGSRGLWAELTGDTELAEYHAEESLRQARLAHTQDAISSWACQLFALRRRQGRAGELSSVVERLARSGGHQLGWLSALGVLRFETGDHAGARRIYEEELNAGADAVPRGMFWLTRMALLSELCAMLKDNSGAEALYAQLAPHANCNVVVTYCSFWGPVEGYLALLAQTTGDATLAGRHLESALARTRAMNAPWLTHDLQERYALLQMTPFGHRPDRAATLGPARSRRR